MAKAQGVSHASVARIWDAHGLKAHRIEGFKLSKDKQFVEKLTDVVGVTSTHRTKRWCSAWMRNRRYKRWIGRNRDCR